MRVVAVHAKDEYSFSKSPRESITIVEGHGVEGDVHSGVTVKPGDIGENVTTEGVDLLDLPTGTRLRLGASAVVELTGLRSPCVQIDAFSTGLQGAMLGRRSDGSLLRKSGVMSIVINGGIVHPGDPIRVELPLGEHHRLEPV